jgi:single-strand DNA-binding protein
VRKGSQLFVEGRLQFSTWESQEGGKRSKLEVVVENFQFLGSARGGAGGGGGGEEGSAGGGERRPARRAPQSQEGGAGGGGGGGGGEVDYGDIPF